MEVCLQGKETQSRPINRGWSLRGLTQTHQPTVT
ncbi:hypothetical protein LINPERPRIM_LOCUS8123 [Linum perenne]